MNISTENMHIMSNTKRYWFQSQTEIPLGQTQQDRNENKSFLLIAGPICYISATYHTHIYIFIYLCFFSPSLLFLKNIVPFALCGHVIFQRHFGRIHASCKHAVLQSLPFISISPNKASSSLHWLNDKHQGLCLLLILWRGDRQKINKLPILYPIWHWLFCCSLPQFPPHPHSFPKLLLCHCILQQLSFSLYKTPSSAFHSHVHNPVPPFLPSHPSCFIRNIIPLIQNPMGSVDL